MGLEIPGYALGAPIGGDDAAETCRGRRHGDGLAVSVVVLPERNPSGGPWELVDLEPLKGVAGVLAVVESGLTANGRPYVVSERASGGTLADRLYRGRLRPAEAVSVLLSVGRALDDARAAGVGHGRLSPANIIMGSHGRTSVTGFLPVRSDLPEAVDVAALGRLLQRAMEPPQDSSPTTVTDEQPGREPIGEVAPPPTVPPDLAAVVDAAVRAGRVGGYDSVSAFVEGLRAVARDHGWPSDRPVAMRTVETGPRRRSASRASSAPLRRSQPAGTASARWRWQSWYWVPTVMAIGGAVAVLALAIYDDEPGEETVAVPAARAAISPTATARPGDPSPTGPAREVPPSTATAAAAPTTVAPSTDPPTTAPPTTVPTTAARATAVPPTTLTSTTSAPATTAAARQVQPDPAVALDRSRPPPVWVVERDGSVTDSVSRLAWLEPVTVPTVDVAVRSDGFGGWQLLADGRIRPFGDAPRVGSGRLLVPLGDRPVELVADATETGLWVVFADGGVVAVGTDLPAAAGPAGPADPGPATVVAADRSVGGAGYLTLDRSGEITGSGDAVVRGSAAGHLSSPLVGLLVFNEAHVVVAADGSFLVISGSGDQVTHELGQLEVAAPVQSVRRSGDRVVVVDADGALAVFSTAAVINGV